MDRELALIEYRELRSYDEKSASTVIHPNGSLMQSQDRALNASLVRAVLEIA